MQQNSGNLQALARDARATLMPGFIGLTMPEWISTAFADGLISVCVYGNNIESREQVQALGHELRAACPSALLAIDEEGGEVTRLNYREGSPYPGAAVLGRIDDLAYTEEVGRRVGADILSAGFNLALAPDADVNSNPHNPVIGTRSFGATPELASRHVAAWVRGLHSAGAIACPKHFPGHGDTAQDSHLTLPVVNVSREELDSRELPPFVAAFDTGARTVMTSHILLPRVDDSRPATFSSVILQDMLRGQLGFTGVIISDALDMHGASGETGIPAAAVRALRAGCDLLCTGVDTTALQFEAIVDQVVSAVLGGQLSRERLNEAAERVRQLSAAWATSRVTPLPTHSVSDTAHTAVGVAAELQRIAASFDGALAAHEWTRQHPGAAIIRVETVANMAVGFAPWGPFAQGAASFLDDQTATAFAARPHLTLDATTTSATVTATAALSAALLLTAKRAGGAIFIGRELHRSAFARAHVEALRAASIDVLVAEMAWPADDDYANVASFGSSALVGAALITLLEGGTL